MRRYSRMRLAAAAVAVGLFAAACGGGGGGDDPAPTEEGGAQGQAGGDLRIYNSEPAFLVPTAANDEPSILVLRQIYRGLVKYNGKTGEPELDIAESIETEDNKTWTITLKDGYTFTNGEPVNADSFIRAWNYTGAVDNAQNNSYFMSRIAGFDKMQSGDAKEFSGLKKVDDLSFTVELSSPFSGFAAVLGYSGFFPVAEECLADFDACNEKPIGNGPYMIDGTWEHNVQINLTRNEDYAGDDPGMADKLLYRIYDEIDTAYAAFQGGELDVMYTIPPERYTEAKRDFGDRMFEQPSDSFTYLGMPLYDDRFATRSCVRPSRWRSTGRASSTPSTTAATPRPKASSARSSTASARVSVSTACTTWSRPRSSTRSPAAWKGGKLELWANAGSGHEAGCRRSVTSSRPHSASTTRSRSTCSSRSTSSSADNHEFTGAFRLGWGPDYPVMETYLQPLYGTGASSNSSGYENPEFDKLIAQGDGAASLQEAIPFVPAGRGH